MNLIMNLLNDVLVATQQSKVQPWSREKFEKTICRIETGRATIKDLRWLATPAPQMGYSRDFLSCLGEIAVTGGTPELAGRLRKFF